MRVVEEAGAEAAAGEEMQRHEPRRRRRTWQGASPSWRVSSRMSESDRKKALWPGATFRAVTVVRSEA